MVRTKAVVVIGFCVGEDVGVSLPEERLAERAIALVRRVEPFADAADMELVSAVLAGKFGQTLVRGVQYTVTDATVFDTVHL